MLVGGECASGDESIYGAGRIEKRVGLVGRNGDVKLCSRSSTTTQQGYSDDIAKTRLPPSPACGAMPQCGVAPLVAVGPD